MRRSYRLRQARPRTALLLVDGPTCPGGDQCAALQTVWGETLVERAARQVEERGAMRVIAITGCQAPDVIEDFLGGQSPRATRMTIPNPDWELGGRLRALAHASRRWTEPVMLLDCNVAWSDDDLDRMCAGQFPLTIGVLSGYQQVGAALFRDRAADWFAERAMHESLLGSRGRPWQALLRGSRGGIATGTMFLDGLVEEESALAIGSW